MKALTFIYFTVFTVKIVAYENSKILRFFLLKNSQKFVGHENIDDKKLRFFLFCKIKLIFFQ